MVSVLAETSMTPGDLTLELTEHADGRHRPRARALDHLRARSACAWRSTISARGIRRSPISKRFPIDELKIDRLFVRGIDRNTRARRWFRRSSRSATAWGLRAWSPKGVETAAHLDVLRRQGCDLAQGFHFSPPLPWKSSSKPAVS